MLKVNGMDGRRAKTTSGGKSFIQNCDLIWTRRRQAKQVFLSSPTIAAAVVDVRVRIQNFSHSKLVVGKPSDNNERNKKSFEFAVFLCLRQNSFIFLSRLLTTSSVIQINLAFFFRAARLRCFECVFSDSICSAFRQYITIRNDSISVNVFLSTKKTEKNFKNEK